MTSLGRWARGVFTARMPRRALARAARHAGIFGALSSKTVCKILPLSSLQTSRILTHSLLFSGQKCAAHCDSSAPLLEASPATTYCHRRMVATGRRFDYGGLAMVGIFMSARDKLRFGPARACYSAALVLTHKRRNDILSLSQACRCMAGAHVAGACRSGPACRRSGVAGGSACWLVTVAHACQNGELRGACAVVCVRELVGRAQAWRAYDVGMACCGKTGTLRLR